MYTCVTLVVSAAGTLYMALPVIVAVLLKVWLRSKNVNYLVYNHIMIIIVNSIMLVFSYFPMHACTWADCQK